MLFELDSMSHKLVAIVVAAAVAVDAVVDVAVGDEIADCSFVVDDFVADDDHAGLENLNFDNFLYSAKQIKILLEISEISSAKRDCLNRQYGGTVKMRKYFTCIMLFRGKTERTCGL